MAKKNYFKEVSKYQKAHPRASIETARAAVSKEFKKAGSVGSAKKKKIGKPVSDNSRGAGHTATKTKADTRNNRTATTTKTITAHVKVGTVGSYMTGAKKLLAKKLGELEANKFMAKKKSEKNRFAREIRDTKSQLRKFL